MVVTFIITMLLIGMLVWLMARTDNNSYYNHHRNEQLNDDWELGKDWYGRKSRRTSTYTEPTHISHEARSFRSYSNSATGIYTARSTHIAPPIPRKEEDKNPASKP